MFNPDGPVGGIWSVRPVGQDRKAAGRERQEGEPAEKRLRRRAGQDTVTLSPEAKKLLLESGNQQPDEVSEEEEDIS